MASKESYRTSFSVNKLKKLFKKHGTLFIENEDPHRLYCAEGVMIKTNKPMYGFKKVSHIDSDGYTKSAIANLIIPKDSFVNFSVHDDGKCRADRAFVHSIVLIDSRKEVNDAVSQRDNTFTYEKHSLVTPKFPFDKSSTYSCSSGIHFFLDLKSAYNY